MLPLLRWALPIALLVFFESAQSVVLVRGEIAIDPPPDRLLRGQVATVQYRLTNIGDEPLDAAFAGVEFVPWGPESTIIPYPTAATPPCTYFEDGPDPIPGQPPFVVGMVRFDSLPIPPGESRTCDIELLVTQQAPDEFDKFFGFTGFNGNTVSPSERLRVTFRLRTRAAEIPAITPMGSLVMLCMFFGIAAWAQTRSNSR